MLVHDTWTKLKSQKTNSQRRFLSFLIFECSKDKFSGKFGFINLLKMGSDILFDSWDWLHIRPLIFNSPTPSAPHHSALGSHVVLLYLHLFKDLNCPGPASWNCSQRIWGRTLWTVRLLNPVNLCIMEWHHTMLRDVETGESRLLG